VSDEGGEKLYVKAPCSLCLGGKRLGIFKNCPYCDKNRETYIEATKKDITETICKFFSDKEKAELIKKLSRDKQDESNI
jgi:hypothetical protein